MFWNIYSKRMLGFARNRETIIWTWIFPLLLSTLFFAVFTNLDASGQFYEIPIGVVDDAAYRQDISFRAAVESVAGGGDGRLFDLRLCPDVNEADVLLEKGEIYGYFVAGGIPTLAISGNGIEQTIAKNFLDRYLQTKNSVSLLLSQGANSAEQLSARLQPLNYTEEISLSGSPQTDKVNYFYALLALVCMYGGFQGLTTITQLQANLSALGARKSVAPVRRFRMAGYDLLAGFSIQYLCLLAVLAYIRFVLGVSFGSQTWMVLLTCFAGSILGVSFGAMISALTKLKEQAKVAILITVSMVCCFLSGMMVGGINYTIAQKAPAVSWLNPAARITDAFYCLYYYDTYERYFLNIGIILAMTIVMLAITAVFVRRQQYESV